MSLMKAFGEFNIDQGILEANQNEAIEFICSFTDDEMTGLSTISKCLDRYCLRDLKGLYLYNNKEEFTIGGLFGRKESKIVVKKDKQMTLFDLARSVIVSLTEKGTFGDMGNGEEIEIGDNLRSILAFKKMNEKK